MGVSAHNSAYSPIIEALRSYEPERIYLFGSHARNEADTLSDIDLIVIKKTNLPFLERLREIQRYLPQDAGSVDILVYTPEELDDMQRRGNAFGELIQEEAQLIYDRQA
jgi:predicted nucleotidyltransferase